jgi:thiamine-monophosphate kinase
LPRACGLALAKQLYEGLLPLAAEFDTALAGGDTNTYDGPLVLSVTAFGRLTDFGPFLRSGARPGDEILVTGDFGGSILGKHLTFSPRVNEALILRQYDVHAAMDVSDGLSLDLSRMCAASGCGAEINLSAVPLAAAAHELSKSRPDGRTALDHALADGEDFELILAVPPAEARRLCEEQPLGDVRLTSIGRFIDAPGLWSVAAGDARRRLEPQGYEH